MAGIVRLCRSLRARLLLREVSQFSVALIDSEDQSLAGAHKYRPNCDRQYRSGLLCPQLGAARLARALIQ